MGQSDTLIRVDMGTEWLERLISVIVGVVVAIVAVIVIAALGAALAAVASVVIPALTASASIGLGSVIVAAGAGVVSGVYVYNTQFPEDLMLPVYSLSPEEIFKGQILLFDIDFFNPVTEIKVHTDIVDENGNRTGDGNVYSLNDYKTDQELNEALADNEQIRDYFYVEDGEEIITSKQNTALDLQVLVSQWYSAIRNIAIVLAMSVLLYIGIRMMLSTVAQDKAKYKQMLMDWLISICLLFFMHYIMSFSISIVNELTKVLTISNTDSGTGYVAVLELDDDGKLKEAVENLGMSDAIQDDKVMWPTNLMGQLRIQAQMSYGDASFIGYGLCFFVLVLLTLFYIFTYLRRVLYMAFLTMISPLVALTYPIDKISDGQAQAFNKWLKEYIFNLLIQPLHLLIYTVLVTSAFDLAGKNPLYSIVAIGFMIPAEKLMRSFFGFEKASTPGSLAGAAVGAGLVNSGLQKLLHPGFMSGGKGGSGKGGDGSSDSNSSTKIGYKDKVNSIDALSGAENNNGNDQDGDQGGNINFADGNDDDGGDLGSGTGDSDGGNDSAQLPRTREPGSYSLFGNAGRAIGNFASSNRVTGKPIRKIKGAAGYVTRGAKGIARGIKGKASGAVQGIQNNDTFRMLADSKEGQAIKRAGRNVRYTATQGIRQTRKTVGGAIGALPNVATRAAAGVALGATAGAIGAGAAIASGDPSNLITYGGGAFATAAAIGASRTGVNMSDSKSAAQIAKERAVWGDKYDEHVADRNLKQLKRSMTQREELEKELGVDAVKELYKKGTIDTYYKNDVTSAKEIAALEALKKDGEANVNSTEEAIAVKDLYDKYGSFDKMKKDDRALYKEDLKDKFMKKLGDEGKANQKVDEVVGKIERFHKINKNFQ